jgi:putative DNA primase/helicase
MSRIETPQEAARRISARVLGKGYRATSLDVYRLANGRPWCWRIRCDHPVKGKWMRPMFEGPGGFEVAEPPMPASGKPLYRLPELIASDASAPVFVAEGEACANALAKLGLVATTSGSCTSANAADWSAMAGRRAIIWPDKDEPGTTYAQEASECIRTAGGECEWLDVAQLGLVEKGDCVDWIADHPDATAADVLSLPRVMPGRPSAPRYDDAPRVMLRKGSDVQPESVSWLWPGHVPEGKLVILAGPPGTGKTTLALSIAAAVTSGGRWPDGSRAPIGSVVIWSGEDDNADTINPRLRLAGADVSRVYTIEGVHERGQSVAFDPATDIDLLRDAMRSVTGPVRLLVIDPIVSAVSGDGHKNGDVRRGLQPLVDLAAQFRCALIGVTHFSKGTAGRDPVERITGSVAFGALARVVLLAAKQEEEPDRAARRVMLRAKSNCGPDGGGFVYDLQQADLPGFPGIVNSRVLWGAAIEGTARELLAETEPEAGGERSALDEARDWLTDALASGPQSAKAIKSEAGKAGIRERTLDRAKNTLRVRAAKDGFAGGWQWSLPKREECQERQERQEFAPQNVGSLGALGDDRTAADAPVVEAVEF